MHKKFYYILLLMMTHPLFGFADSKVPISFYNFKLESLSTFSFFNTKELTGHSSLWVLFQPSCVSCKSQLNDLSCLPKNIKTIALGSQGQRDSLVKALQSSSFRGHRLMISNKMQKNLNSKITPTLFLVDNNGVLQKTLLGFTPCEQIRMKFDHLNFNTRE